MPQVAARTAIREREAGRYQRHRPEQTLLYQIVDEYYPAFVALLAEQGKELPGYVQREFEAFLQCGRLEHGFLRVRCESCRAEHLFAFSCKRRGFCPSCGAWRMADDCMDAGGRAKQEPAPRARLFWTCVNKDVYSSYRSRCS
jgi:ribosomal protein S27E